jgi:hypothetical protein
MVGRGRCSHLDLLLECVLASSYEMYSRHERSPLRWPGIGIADRFEPSIYGEGGISLIL